MPPGWTAGRSSPWRRGAGRRWALEGPSRGSGGARPHGRAPCRPSGRPGRGGGSACRHSRSDRPAGTPGTCRAAAPIGTRAGDWRTYRPRRHRRGVEHRLSGAPGRRWRRPGCRVPPPLPPRYRLEVRLGQDGDIDEWLGVDTALDRPVLIRIVGPEVDAERRARFLDAVRAAARCLMATSPPSTRRVRFSAGSGICEWGRGHHGPPAERGRDHAGGRSSWGMRQGWRRDSPPACRRDSSRCHRSLGHPLLGRAPGQAHRIRQTGLEFDPAEDVHDLAAALDSSLTGQPAGRIPPSEVIDGVDPAVDRAWNMGCVGSWEPPNWPRSCRRLRLPRRETGPPTRRGGPGAHWRAADGRRRHGPAGGSLTARPQSPVLFPRRPDNHCPRPPPQHSPPTASTTTTIAAGSVAIVGIEVFDPPPR